MRFPEPFPFLGEVIWLTPDQGGRRKGVPPAPHLAVTGFVPPHTVDDGLASFVLKGWDPTAWRSPAEGMWLLVEAEGAQRVRAGSVVHVTEGRRTVALFLVDRIRDGEGHRLAP
ncbi:MAG TPA: hypothetical protein VK507_13155 [Iamia sp.]|nr:hypothetical protein [Iamia sp.]